MSAFRRALRRALPLACTCVATVGIVVVLFGKTTSVVHPNLSGASASPSTAPTATVPTTTASTTIGPTTTGDTVQVESEPPPPTTTAPSTAPKEPTPVTVAVIGDTYTAPSDIGGQGEHNWTAIIAAELAGAGYDVHLDVAAEAGSGYVKIGTAATNFGDRIERIVTADTSIVVIFGSRYDDGIIPREQVGTTAAAQLARVRQIAPQAKILVIGAPWVDQDYPGYISGIEWELKAAAAGAGARFLDPIAGEWFFSDDSSLIGPDDVSPTDAGHEYLAAKILPAITALLPPR